MHTDLSPHLHTDKCNELIRILRQCRVDHALTKFLGKCNPEYDAMSKCLKQERIARRQRSFEMSKQNKARLSKIFKEQAEAKESNT